MTIEANAIIGLTLWLLSHDRLHFYDRGGSRLQLWASLVLGFAAAFFLLLAAARAVGLVR